MTDATTDAATDAATGATTDAAPGAASDGSAPLARGPLGMDLLGFHEEPEGTRFDDAPVGYVLVVLWRAGRLLMVRVRGRDCWELPGGGIEDGETPRRAAARELWEESGRRVAPDLLRFVGFARTSLRGRVMYGAVYTAEVDAGTDGTPPFTPTEEIAAIHWRDGDEPLEGGVVQTVDEYLAALCRP
ncbi:NUDIX domain-containing protein [Streptomyces macrosporus]|uniref:Nudix hydrolase domain-containing protein n=1 Tax=Streptomyces macrosporus TaxID=44032 RepID=A0ABN3JPQ4_9ACTN